jgi:glutamine amidotransferase
MCRLYAIHSFLENKVAAPLVYAKNSLAHQSREHSDGWGLCYYDQGVPNIIKSLSVAQNDALYKELASSIKAHTILVHLRRATQGEVSLVNCHPFRFGPWIMAHNGDFPDFVNMRPKLLSLIDKNLGFHVVGTTDSEIYFGIFLTTLNRQIVNTSSPCPVTKVATSLRSTFDQIFQAYDRLGVTERPVLNTIITNGQVIVGARQGSELCYLPRWLESDTPVAGLQISSESLSAEEDWVAMEENQIIGMGEDFRLQVGL